MKHVKVFEEFKHGDLTPEQVEWLNSVVKGTWKLTSEGRVDVNGSVNASSRKDLKTFPVEFGKVTDNFYCYSCASLTTLQGSPSEVGGNFVCSGCDSLTTLQGSPGKVTGHFYCYDCASLTTLQGSPSKVGGDFNCSGCVSLATLQGSPKKVTGGFFCYECASLTTLQGSPSEVGGGFVCSNCPRLPPEELDLLKLDRELFLKWANSGMKIQDFLHRNRGTLKGKKFGI